MNAERCNSISIDRLTIWADSVHTIPVTPTVCVWVGHGALEGEVHLTICDNADELAVADLMESTAQVLRRQWRADARANLKR